MWHEERHGWRRGCANLILLTALVVPVGCSKAADPLPSDNPQEDAGLQQDAGGDGAGDAAVIEPAMRAEIDGRLVIFTIRASVSHDVGRSVEISGTEGDAFPRINGALVFDANGRLNPCGERLPWPSTMVVWRTSNSDLFGAPDGLEPTSACTYEVMVRPRCPKDLLVLRFSAALVRGTERLSINNGYFAAPVEFLLHGAPPPPGCG